MANAFAVTAEQFASMLASMDALARQNLQLVAHVTQLAQQLSTQATALQSTQQQVCSLQQPLDSMERAGTASCAKPVASGLAAEACASSSGASLLSSAVSTPPRTSVGQGLHCDALFSIFEFLDLSELAVVSRLCSAWMRAMQSGSRFCFTLDIPRSSAGRSRGPVVRTAPRAGWRAGSAYRRAGHQPQKAVDRTAEPHQLEVAAAVTVAHSVPKDPLAPTSLFGEPADAGIDPCARHCDRGLPSGVGLSLQRSRNAFVDLAPLA